MHLDAFITSVASLLICPLKAGPLQYCSDLPPTEDSPKYEGFLYQESCTGAMNCSEIKETLSSFDRTLCSMLAAASSDLSISFVVVARNLIVASYIGDLILPSDPL